MKETIKNMLEHPIATIIIICALFNGIVNVIIALKKDSLEPIPIIKIETVVNEPISASGDN